MEINELVDAYLASRKKQFTRLSKEGVARIAYIAGYLAAQQSVQRTVGGAWHCSRCNRIHNGDEDVEAIHADPTTAR